MKVFIIQTYFGYYVQKEIFKQMTFPPDLQKK